MEICGRRHGITAVSHEVKLSDECSRIDFVKPGGAQWFSLSYLYRNFAPIFPSLGDICEHE